jgi:hypothetical protein
MGKSLMVCFYIYVAIMLFFVVDFLRTVNNRLFHLHKTLYDNLEKLEEAKESIEEKLDEIESNMPQCDYPSNDCDGL